jgi:hypothetical protein
MTARVGTSYLIDHGGGRQSLRLIVGLADSELWDGVVWRVAVLHDDQSYLNQERESTLEYWDYIAKSGGGNVRKLT